ncbi:MAG: DUF5018 domain-containing protein [Alistipes sp.]|nr:DUF5018 domain-containing protein [Alistipes sp.]
MKKITAIKSLVLKTLGAPALLWAFCACGEDIDRPARGTENEIVRFALQISGTEYQAVIGEDAIVVTVPRSLSLAGATARVTISDDATILPLPSQVDDWNEEVLFGVTAASGDRKTYIYTVRHADVAISGGSVVLSTPP